MAHRVSRQCLKPVERASLLDLAVARHYGAIEPRPDTDQPTTGEP